MNRKHHGHVNNNNKTYKSAFSDIKFLKMLFRANLNLHLKWRVTLDDPWRLMVRRPGEEMGHSTQLFLTAWDSTGSVSDFTITELASFFTITELASFAGAVGAGLGRGELARPALLLGTPLVEARGEPLGVGPLGEARGEQLGVGPHGEARGEPLGGVRLEKTEARGNRENGCAGVPSEPARRLAIFLGLSFVDFM